MQGRHPGAGTSTCGVFAAFLNRARECVNFAVSPGYGLRHDSVNHALPTLICQGP